MLCFLELTEGDQPKEELCFSLILFLCGLILSWFSGSRESVLVLLDLLLSGQIGTFHYRPEQVSGVHTSHLINSSSFLIHDRNVTVHFLYDSIQTSIFRQQFCFSWFMDSLQNKKISEKSYFNELSKN